MDACHVLLGRPWQFDRRTKHDGHKSTYTFQKDGITITLGPTDLMKEPKSHLLSRSEFQFEVSKETEGYALEVTEANDVGLEVPPGVASLFEGIT